MPGRSQELFYLNLGIDFVNVYGATETGFPITAANCNDKYPTEGAGNVNQFPEISVIIDNPDNNGIGEIRVKTPLIMGGYYKDNEELTATAFDDNGYFKTGDCGYIDKKGNLFCDRQIKKKALSFIMAKKFHLLTLMPFIRMSALILCWQVAVCRMKKDMMRYICLLNSVAFLKQQ